MNPSSRFVERPFSFVRLFWHTFWHLCALLALLLGLGIAPAAYSQTQDTPRTPIAAAVNGNGSAAEAPLPLPDDLRKQLGAIPAQFEESSDARKYLAQLNVIGANADRLAKKRTEELADIDGLLTGLGPAPEKGSPADAPDVDGDLYGGFLSHGDRRKLDHLRGLQGDALHSARTAFEDERLEELFFRYRARNFVQGMTAVEQQRWFTHCLARLQNGAGGARSLAALHTQIETLQADCADEAQQAILEDLYSYADELVYSLESWQEQLKGLL